jgi:hypothetical protein
MESTREDFRELRHEVRDGFHGTHARLDIMNGRVTKGEIESAAHAIQIKALEEALREIDAQGKTDEGPVRRRDVFVFMAGGGALLSALKFMGLL